MKVYLADKIIGDCLYCIDYMAKNEQEAIEISRRNGWEYCGEKIDEQEVEPTIMAMLELRLREPTLH